MAVIITLIKFQERKEEKYGKSEDISLDLSSRFEVDSYLPIINQILLSMKTRLEAYDCLQRKFSFVMELNTMSNCKIEASAKTLLQYYLDDLEESLLP